MLLPFQGTEPTRAHDIDAGYDLQAAVLEPITLYPSQTLRIPTQLRLQVPYTHAGLVLSRSGLADRHSVAVLNAPGLIDPGFTGEVQVILHNFHAELPFLIEPQARIAQIIFVPVDHPVWVPWRRDTAEESKRGERGLGSTGSGPPGYEQFTDFAVDAVGSIVDAWNSDNGSRHREPPRWAKEMLDADR